MKVDHYYTERFKKRYILKVSFWKAFVNFFDFYPHLYDDAVKHIAKKSTKEALMSDVSAIQEDAYKVISEHELQDIGINKAKARYAVEQE